jgi:hypothetical protein
VRMLKPIEHTGINNEGVEWTEYITRADVERMILRKVETLFNPNKLILFPDRPIKLVQDTIEKHFTFFENCYAVSTKDGYTVQDYEDLKDGYVWEDSILNRRFTKPEKTGTGVFEKFTYDITGNTWDLDTDTHLNEGRDRLRALLIAGGYMLHNFTDMERKVVIITQGRLSEDDTSEGREGKTLWVQMLGKYMLNRTPDESKTFVYVPGKDYNNTNKHKWQRVDMNTTCVLLDDPAELNFEDFYNVAENSFPVSHMHKAEIPVKARLVITTNRPVERDSGSSKARSCVIELDSCFDADYTPDRHKYMHRFGTEWINERVGEWQLFDDFVLGTVLPAYFANNARLIEPSNKNLMRNELFVKARRMSGSVEIVFWLDILFRGSVTERPYFATNIEYQSADLYNKLIADRDMFRDHKRLKSSFSKLMRSYLDKEGIAYESERNSKGTWFKFLRLPEPVVPAAAETMRGVEAAEPVLVKNNGVVYEVMGDDLPF